MSNWIFILTIIILVAIGIAQTLRRRRTRRAISHLITRNEARHTAIKNEHPRDTNLLSWYSGGIAALKVALALVVDDKKPPRRGIL